MQTDNVFARKEYIEREAAKLHIFEYGIKHRDNGVIASACENLERQMNSIPAADVVPVRHGKWEWNDNNGYYYCSLCKSIAPKEDQDGNYYDWVNYCPNCGALMDKDGDGE